MQPVLETTHITTVSNPLFVVSDIYDRLLMTSK